MALFKYKRYWYPLSLRHLFFRSFACILSLSFVQTILSYSHSDFFRYVPVRAIVIFSVIIVVFRIVSNIYYRYYGQFFWPFSIVHIVHFHLLDLFLFLFLFLCAHTKCIYTIQVEFLIHRQWPMFMSIFKLGCLDALNNIILRDTNYNLQPKPITITKNSDKFEKDRTSKY